MPTKKIYLLLTISIVLSTSAIIISIVRIEPVKWDGLAAMAGVLSVLVTMLIGWQILNAIEIEKKIQKTVNEKINNSSKELEKDVVTAIINANLSQDIESARFYTIHRDWDKLSSLYRRIIEAYIKLEEKDKVNEMIEPIRILCANHIKDIQETHKKELISVLKKAMPYSDRAYDLIKMIDQ